MSDTTYAQDRLNAANSDLREARAIIGKLTQEIERLKKENGQIAAQALRDAATETDGDLLDLLVAEDDSQFAHDFASRLSPGGSVEIMRDWLEARADMTNLERASHD